MTTQPAHAVQEPMTGLTLFAALFLSLLALLFAGVAVVLVGWGKVSAACQAPFLLIPAAFFAVPAFGCGRINYRALRAMTPEPRRGFRRLLGQGVFLLVATVADCVFFGDIGIREYTASAPNVQGLLAFPLACAGIFVLNLQLKQWEARLAEIQTAPKGTT